MDSLTTASVSSLLELLSDSRSNGIHPLVPLDAPESKGNTMETVGAVSHGSPKLKYDSGLSETRQNSIPSINLVNSDDEIPQHHEHNVVKTTLVGLPADAISPAACDESKQSKKNSDEPTSRHQDIGNDNALFSLSDRLVALSSDSSLDTDEDLEEALLKADLTRIRDLNGGRRIGTRRSPRLSKIDPVTTIVCTRVHKNVSSKRKNVLKTAVVSKTIRNITQVTSSSKPDSQYKPADITDADKTSSDDSVICLDNDEDDVNGDSARKPWDVKNSLGVKRTSFIQAPKVGVFPKYSVKPGVSSFYHIVVPPKSTSTSVITSLKMLPSTVVASSCRTTVSSSSSGSMMSYSSAIQMTSARVNTLQPREELKSLFMDTRIGNLLSSRLKSAESRPVAKVLCEIGSQFVNQYLTNISNLHQKHKRNPSSVTSSNDGGGAKVVVDNADVSETIPTFMNDLKLPLKKCSCGFATESLNVLQHHYEMGRESNGLQHCCLCDDYSARYSSQFVRHMEIEHDRKVRVAPKPSTYLCVLCPFETNGRAIHEKHVRNCQRLFALKSNQRPNPNDCDIPILNTDVKSESLNFGGDLVSGKRIVVTRNDQPISRPPNASSEPKLLRIGNQIFVLMSKPSESATTSTTITQSGGHLGLVRSEKFPQSAVASLRSRGSSPSCRRSLDSNSPFPNIAADLLTTSLVPGSTAMPLAGQNNVWVSQLAAAAAKSVLSGNMASSKVAAPAKTLFTPVSASSVESVNSGAYQSTSTNSFKSVIQHPSDRITTLPPVNLAALLTSTSISDASSKSSLQIPSIPLTSVSKPLAFCQLSSSSTAASRHSLPNETADKQLPARTSRRETKRTTQDPFIICPMCSGFVRDFESLETHMSVCHKAASSTSTSRCTQCIPAKCFPTSEELCRHQVECHGNSTDGTNGYCPQCDSAGFDDILAHVKTKHDVSLLSMYNSRFCFLCNSMFESTKAFENHMVGSHKSLCMDIASLRKKIYSSNARMVCPVCGKKDLFNLIRHMENRHGITPFEMLQLLFCNYCSYDLENATDFESHMLERHAELFPSRDYLWDEIFSKQKCSDLSDLTDGFGGTFKCSSCDDEFVSASYRFRHEIINHPKSSFVCSLCRRNFETGEALASHQKINHPGTTTSSPKQSNNDKAAGFSSSNGNGSPESVNLCSSPETVVITDEEEQTVEPIRKQARLDCCDALDVEKIIPPESIEEVLEIDGDTVIIVQEKE